MKRAVVLEGGGARGAFGAGVLLYLADHPEVFRPEMVCGTSVGALNGAAFAFGLVPELVATWCRLTPADVYRRRSLLRHITALLVERRFTHLYDTAPLRRLLTRMFGNRKMRECPLRVAFSAFNLQTGDIQDFDNDSPVPVVDALMASTALQGLFPPPNLGGFQYLDGANGSNLPLRPALQAGASEVLVVRSGPPQAVTPWPYRDMLALQKRAHLSLMARLTGSDLARARELTRALRRHRRERRELREAVAITVSDPFQRHCLLRRINRMDPLLPDRRPVRLRVVEPPPGAPAPELLDFDPDVSLELLRLGYEETRRLLNPAVEVPAHVRP